MIFSEVIKKIRREVKKMLECVVAMPDVSLLPPSANLSYMTTDCLIGMNTAQKELQ